jgi:hypothetical protein
MSFTIYAKDGTRYQQWFPSICELLDSMVKNPKDRYHRNV